jgi:hypothetical protein
MPREAIRAASQFKDLVLSDDNNRPAISQMSQRQLLAASLAIHFYPCYPWFASWHQDFVRRSLTF